MNFGTIKCFDSYCRIFHYICFFNNIYFFPFKVFNNSIHKIYFNSTFINRYPLENPIKAY